MFFLILALVAIFSAKRNHFSNFGRVPFEKYFQMSFKDFSILALAAILFNGAKPLRPSWISHRHDFSSFRSRSQPVATEQVSPKAAVGPTWIFDRLSFSYFVSTRRPNAPHQVLVQLDYKNDLQNINS